MEGESAAISTTIQSNAMCVFPCGLMVFALIQKHSGLLTGEQSHFKLLAVFFNQDGIRYWIADRVIFEGKSFQFTNSGVVSKYDRSRLVLFLKQRSDERFEFINSLT